MTAVVLTGESCVLQHNLGDGTLSSRTNVVLGSLTRPALPSADRSAGAASTPMFTIIVKLKKTEASGVTSGITAVAKAWAAGSIDCDKVRS